MTGYQELRTGVAWIDLSSRGRIRATGEDRARLVHAMSTNDVQNLAPDAGLYAFFLNDKGRILMDAYIYHLRDSLLLDTEPETGAKLFEHLDRFIIADDVTLEDESASLSVIGIEGPESLNTAAHLRLPVSQSKYGVQMFDAGFTARTSVTGAPGFRLFIPHSERDSWIALLEDANVPAASPEAVRTVRLENGVPRYGEEISERYLVQETQVAQAMHWNKGCYLGQEIVERVRSRGQVHRLLTPIRIVGTHAPAPGTKLSANGVDVAEISSAVYSPALGEVVGLAYMRSEALEKRPQMSVAGSDPELRASLVA